MRVIRWDNLSMSEKKQVINRLSDFGLISRHKAIQKYCREHCGCEPEECGCTLERDGAEECTFVRFLKRVPSALPGQKKANWVKDKDGTTTCTNCGFALEDWIQGAFYKFCPNCGANMSKEESE